MIVSVSFIFVQKAKLRKYQKSIVAQLDTKELNKLNNN